MVSPAGARIFRSAQRSAVSWAVMRGLLGVVLCCLLLAGCAPGWNLPPLPPAPPGPYRIGVDEQLRIITFGDDRLTGAFKVSDEGTIAMPLIGIIDAQGLTTTQLADRIAQRIKDRNVLLNPSVSVQIEGYRPVFVLGEVAKPAQYPYQPGMTVLMAVTLAGGFTYRAQEDHASILRVIDGHPVEGRVDRGTKVEPGDVINILPRYF
jgi:polysaccharide export outer membrane protein